MEISNILIKSVQQTSLYVYLEGTMGLSWYLSSKDSASNAVDLGWIPVSRRSPVEGNSNPLQYSCLENPIDREAWQAAVHSVAELDTTEASKQQQREKELYPQDTLENRVHYKLKPSTQNIINPGFKEFCSSAFFNFEWTDMLERSYWISQLRKFTKYRTDTAEYAVKSIPYYFALRKPNQHLNKSIIISSTFHRKVSFLRKSHLLNQYQHDFSINQHQQHFTNIFLSSLNYCQF